MARVLDPIARCSRDRVRSYRWGSALIAVLVTLGLQALEVQIPVAVGTNPDVPRVSIGDGATATLLKAIARGGTAPYTYTWDVDGNGTADTAPAVADANGNLPASHVYAVAATRNFIAKVTVTDSSAVPVTVTAEHPVVIYTDGDADSEIRTQKAIDDGLWYLHRSLTYQAIDADEDSGTAGVEIAYFDGIFDGTGLSLSSEYGMGSVGVAVQAFQNKGFRIDSPNAEDPYVEDVQRMHNYLLSRFILMPANIDSLQVHTRGGIAFNDNADVNDNDIALTIEASHMPYVVSLSLIAIATSQAPDAVADPGLQQYVGGRRYQDIAQDVVDMLAFAQIDSGTGRGSWLYQTYFDNAGSSPDGSQQHFVATALQWSRDLLGARVPAFVIEELEFALAATQNTVDYGFGYSDSTNWVNTRKTAGNLGTFALLGTGTPDLEARFLGAVRYVADHWGPHPNINPGGISGGGFFGVPDDPDPFKGDHYAMYSLMKGVRSFDPPIETLSPTDGDPIDWDQEFTAYLHQTQRPDGSWLGAWLHNQTFGGPISTAAMVEVLETSPLVTPPVAKATADATNVAGGTTVDLRHQSSYHLGVGRSLVAYTWDFDDGGSSSDHVSTDPDEVVPFVVPKEAGDYTVTLTVEDDIGDTDTDHLTISVTIQNHAPVAVAGPDGGYRAAIGGSVVLDGSDSYDPDTGEGDTIAAYAWDTDGDGSYDDLVGPDPVFDIPDAWTSGNYSVALQVTDVGDVLGGPLGLTGVGTAVIKVVTEIAPPELQAVVRADPPDGVHVSTEGSTDADSLALELVFDESVYAVPSDFLIATTGTVTTNPDLDIEVAGNVVTATVSGIAGDGTLTVTLAASNAIADGIGNIGATLDADLDPQGYIIDNSQPSGVFDLMAAPRATPVSVLVLRFGEAVVGLDAEDLEIEVLPAGGGAAAGVSLNGVEILDRAEFEAWRSGEPVAPAGGSGETFYFIGIDEETSVEGTYTAAIRASTSAIQDLIGHALAADIVVDWVVAPPEGIINGFVDGWVTVNSGLAVDVSLADLAAAASDPTVEDIAIHDYDPTTDAYAAVSTLAVEVGYFLGVEDRAKLLAALADYVDAHAGLPTAGVDLNIELTTGWNLCSLPVSGIDLDWSTTTIGVILDGGSELDLGGAAGQSLIQPIAWVYDPITDTYLSVGETATTSAADLDAIPADTAFWIYVDDASVETLTIILPADG